MLQVFLSIIARLRRGGPVLRAIANHAEEERWRRDPLSHPDIAAMSPRELADLPFRQGPACRC